MSIQKELAIVGCGPAGLSAAINAEIRNLDFVLFGSNYCSPRLRKAPEVNNYLGFYDISGEELINKYMEHIDKMNINIERNRVENIYKQKSGYTLLTREQEIEAKSVILTVGISNEKSLTGEEELVGMGVSYCATCDGPLYKNKTVAVIASTQEGLNEVDYLAEVAEKVYLITDMEIQESDRKKLAKKAEIINKEPTALEGENKIEKIKFKDGSLKVDGVFIYRKVTPPDKLLAGLKTDDEHIIVDKNMATNLDGVFAAGDCTGLPYQIGKAAGEGQIAALEAAAYIQDLKNTQDS